jgi:hypothetical protein
MYRRALEAQPNDVVNLGNYAGFLLGEGRIVDGLTFLRRVLGHPDLSRDESLRVESWFYAFAHRPPRQRPKALAELKRALQGGARSPGWDLSQNVAQAAKDGHPDLPWLQKLADVISAEAQISILDGWAKWDSA